MKNLLPLLMFNILLFENAGLSHGADFRRGIEAYNNSDYVTALKEWEPLAEGGDADVQYNLGIMYDLGQGVRQDYIAAVRWYTLAAEQGHASAHAALGQMHQNGEGVPQDLIRAHMWFQIAALAGVKYANEARDILLERLSISDIEKAKNLVRECIRKKYKDC